MYQGTTPTFVFRLPTVLPGSAFTVSPTELMTEGTQQITVSYAERGVSVAAQFAVEVAPFDPHVANWTEFEAKYPDWDVIETECVTWDDLEGI